MWKKKILILPKYFYIPTTIWCDPYFFNLGIRDGYWHPWIAEFDTYLVACCWILFPILLLLPIIPFICILKQRGKAKYELSNKNIFHHIWPVDLEIIASGNG